MEEGLTGYEIAKKLGVTSAMVSTYKNNNYMPSITVAKKVYAEEGITLHPFSEESLKYELNKEKRKTPPLPGMCDEAL